MPTSDDALLFSETQYFRQWWLLPMQFGMFALFGAILIQQLVLHHPVGNHPMSDTGAVVSFLVVGVVMPILFLSSNLATEVRRDGLYIRFFPFHLRFIKIEGIQQPTACEYRPLADYGGWGIRLGTAGKAYTVRGNQGVKLIRGHDQTLLIGSQQPKDLEAAIASTLHR